MSDFFILENSSDDKIIGTYPQTEGLTLSYGKSRPESVTNLRSDSFPDFIPDLRFKLDKKAKLTDVISPSNINRAHGLFVNQKVKGILLKSNLLHCKLFEGSLENKGHNINYFWLHVLDQSLEATVDFQKSRFFTMKLFFKKDEEINLESELDLKAKIAESQKLILAEKIELLPKFRENVPDIMYFPLIQKPMTYFISEKLANDLMESKVTGIEIKKQDILQL